MISIRVYWISSETVSYLLNTAESEEESASRSG